MTAAAIRFVLDHWKLSAIVVLALAVFAATAAAVDQWRDSIAWEAIAAERLQDFRTSDSARAALAREVAARDSAARRDSIRIAALVAHADSVERELADATREASRRAVAAGESLEATLDSIRVAEVVRDARRLAGEALRQWRDHEAADRDQVAAYEGRLRAERDEGDALRESVSLWRTRWEDERDLRQTTEAALDQARGALEARTQAAQDSWTDHPAVQTAALAGALYAGWKARGALDN